MTTHTICGLMMDNGYIVSPQVTSLSVTVRNGRLYDTDLLAMAPSDEARLTVDADGHLTGWGAGVRFEPAAGELARIGVASA
jgi:hypothetical protein